MLNAEYIMMRKFTSVALSIVLALSVVDSAWALGSLTVTGGAPGTFSTTLTGTRQTVYSTLATYQAADTTLSLQGWHITFQATQFKCTAGVGNCPIGGNSLPLGSLVLAPPTVACHTGTLCVGVAAPPSISISANTAIDTTLAVKVASAAANTGSGTYDFTPGLVDGISNHNLSLAVPSWAYATTYNSTVTVSIGTGP